MRVDERIRRTLDQIRHHTTRLIVTSPPTAKKPVHTPALEVTFGQALRLIYAGLSPSPTVDGFSSTTPGNGSPGSGKGGGRMMSVPGEQPGDVNDLVPTSSTEAAALDRLAGRRDRDLVASMAREQLAALHLVARTLEEIRNRNDRFDQMRDARHVADAPQCYIASTVFELPWDDQWAPLHRTDFSTIRGFEDKVLDEPRPVCTFVYWFTRRNRRLPTRDEMLANLERRTLVR